MSDKKSIEVNLKLGWISALVYVGLGFICHLFFIGSNIVWTDAFSLFMIFLWPFYLFYLALWVIFWVIVVFGVFIIIYLVLQKIGIIN